MIVLPCLKQKTIRVIVPPSLTTQLITVTLIDSRGNSAKIGIEAADAVRILRGDVEDDGRAVQC